MWNACFTRCMHACKQRLAVPDIGRQGPFLPASAYPIPSYLDGRTWHVHAHQVTRVPFRNSHALNAKRDRELHHAASILRRSLLSRIKSFVLSSYLISLCCSARNFMRAVQLLSWELAMQER